MPVPQAFFMPAREGETSARFCIYHPPRGEYLRGAVLYVHPFAEEMNKSRRMVALQARALAGSGHAVLQIDLQGCGDSSGDFGEAAWDGWIKDVVQAARWLQRRHPAAPLWLWGLRAGCLLAAEAAQHLDAPCHFLFWAPPASGRPLLQQFLRLKAAGELLGGGARAAAEELRRRREAGLPVEIAGYRLAPGLMAGLEGAALRPPFAPRAVPGTGGAPGDRSRVVWFELSPREEAPLSAAASAALATWEQAGHEVQGRRVQGPAFWQTPEIEEAPALLEATLAALAEGPPPPGMPRLGLPDAADLAEPGPCLPAPAAAPAEEPLHLDCRGEALLGVLHRSRADADTAVLVIVGGPQYRAGSHRQFVLLARRLATAGHPVLRFDVRGMGDSGGAMRGFEHTGEDIRCAIDRLQQRLPAVRRVVLWGLCDGASAALLYCDATGDARVHGVCVLNPWVRSPATEARTLLKHYYAARVLQPDFWRKLLGGRVASSALDELLQKVKAANGPRAAAAGPGPSFQQRMARGWQALDGRVLLILSGEDHTAREFLECAAGDAAWHANLRHPRLVRHELRDADHTFSDPAASRAVEALTLDWLARLAPAPRRIPAPERQELRDGSPTS